MKDKYLESEEILKHSLPTGELPFEEDAAPASSSPPSPTPSEELTPSSLLPRTVDPFLGRTLGHLEITKRIGIGGFGAVYRAEHLETRHPFAIKILHFQAPSDEETQNQTILRFQREARTLASLRHPNIVQIADFGLHDIYYYLVMEYLEGETLLRRIKHGSEIPIRLISLLSSQICSALSYIHREGIIHRDIKPSNFLLVRSSPTLPPSVKLIDFGIASLAGDISLTVTGTCLGSPTYMSPEQAEGLTKHLDGRSDLYSLAVVLFQALTGRTPFEGDTFGSLLRQHILTPPPLLETKQPNRSWVPQLNDFFQAALAKDPVARPPHADAFFEHLQAALALQEATEEHEEKRSTFFDLRSPSTFPFPSQDSIPALPSVAYDIATPQPSPRLAPPQESESLEDFPQTPFPRPPTPSPASSLFQEPSLFLPAPPSPASLPAAPLPAPPFLSFDAEPSALPPPPSSRRFLIASIFVLLALVSGLAVWLFFSPEDEPSETFSSLPPPVSPSSPLQRRISPPTRPRHVPPMHTASSSAFPPPSVPPSVKVPVITIRVLSQPPGALVFEASRSLGSTPLTLSAPQDSVRELTVSLPQHRSKSIQLSFSSDASSYLVSLLPLVSPSLNPSKVRPSPRLSAKTSSRTPSRPPPRRTSIEELDPTRYLP